MFVIPTIIMILIFVILALLSISMVLDTYNEHKKFKQKEKQEYQNERHIRVLRDDFQNLEALFQARAKTVDNDLNNLKDIVTHNVPLLTSQVVDALIKEYNLPEKEVVDFATKFILGK